MRSDQSHSTARKCLRPAVVSRNMRLCRKIHPELRKYRGTVAKTHSDQRKMVMGNRANEGIRSFEESTIQRISSCVFPPRCSYVSKVGLSPAQKISKLCFKQVLQFQKMSCAKGALIRLPLSDAKNAMATSICSLSVIKMFMSIGHFMTVMLLWMVTVYLSQQPFGTNGEWINVGKDTEYPQKDKNNNKLR